MELAEWAERYGLVAGITLRGDGLDLGLASPDPTAQVMARRRAFAAAFPEFPARVASHQVHGVDVAWHAHRSDGWLILEGVDAHATLERGLLLTITVADCIPIYLATPSGAVALAHAGWRSVSGGILGRAIEVLTARAPCPVADIVMHCGVGICGSCYTVGPEVLSRFVRGAETGGPLDLRGVLVAQARALGLRVVSCSPWCTAHDRSRFFSHRASGGQDGRLVAYLGRPLA